MRACGVRMVKWPSLQSEAVAPQLHLRCTLQPRGSPMSFVSKQLHLLINVSVPESSDNDCDMFFDREHRPMADIIRHDIHRASLTFFNKGGNNYTQMLVFSNL